MTQVPQHQRCASPPEKNDLRAPAAGPKTYFSCCGAKRVQEGNRPKGKEKADKERKGMIPERSMSPEPAMGKGSSSFMLQHGQSVQLFHESSSELSKRALEIYFYGSIPSSILAVFLYFCGDALSREKEMSLDRD
eukprot:scaffold3504_cov240-Pinguiococcus_pyrenoidosus.AAC.37